MTDRGTGVEGSRERAARAYRQYGPMVYRRCLRLLGNREAARDATQEVFVKLIRRIDSLDGRADLLPWLYRVATNHCLNKLRDSARHGDKAMTAKFEIAAPWSAEHFSNRQLAARVLARFDSETSAVAVGVLVDGMEQGEVADLLGISRRTVARKLKRFLQDAKKVVARSGS